MVADTWVNLAQQSRLPPNTTTPPKKPEPKAVAAPASPTDCQTSERGSRKEFGWFWITQKRNAGPLTFARPSPLDTGAIYVVLCRRSCLFAEYKVIALQFEVALARAVCSVANPCCCQPSLCVRICRRYNAAPACPLPHCTMPAFLVYF